MVTVTMAYIDEISSFFHMGINIIFFEIIIGMTCLICTAFEMVEFEIKIDIISKMFVWFRSNAIFR